MNEEAKRVKIVKRTVAIRNALDLIGNLYREDILCEAGYLYQDKTQIFRKKPTFFSR